MENIENTISDVRLWAIQLKVALGRGHTSRYPQFIVEAVDAREAAARARERLCQENANSAVRPEQIEIETTAEIGLENIWLFNDERFRKAN